MPRLRWDAGLGESVAAATAVAATARAVAVILTAAAPPQPNSAFRKAITPPTSAPRRSRLFHVSRVLLQALSERASRAEDQCLDGALCQAQLGRDLSVREALPLAQQNRAALVLRHRLEDFLQANELVRPVVRAGDDLLQHLEVVR